MMGCDLVLISVRNVARSIATMWFMQREPVGFVEPWVCRDQPPGSAGNCSLFGSFF